MLRMLTWGLVWEALLPENSKLRRDLKKRVSITHEECAELAGRHGISLRSVIAQAVRDNVRYVPLNRQGPSDEELEDLQAAREDDGALQARLLHAKMMNDAQPFTTGIFHPMALPILIFTLMVAGCFGAFTD